MCSMATVTLLHVQLRGVALPLRMRHESASDQSCGVARVVQNGLEEKSKRKKWNPMKKVGYEQSRQVARRLHRAYGRNRAKQ